MTTLWIVLGSVLFFLLWFGIGHWLADGADGGAE